MKVNQNVSAVISNAQLHRTENQLTASIERLSSGYKINKAKDNPAGIAISNKMRAQIEALDQSSRNAEDGTSVLQTADGALNETHAMLQRMRELAVQAATDTMTTEDKEACQQEIESLQAEVDRIATDTEFNGKQILDGTQDYRVYPSVKDATGVSQLAGTCIRNFQTSDNVVAQDYQFTIEELPTQATMSFPQASITVPGTVSINGSKAEISEGDDADEIYRKLQEAGEYGGVKVEKDGTDYKLTSLDYGKSAKITCTEDDVQLATPAEGTDTKIKKDANGCIDGNGFSETATLLTDGKKVTIRDLNGFEMIFEVDPSKDAAGLLANNTTVDLEMTDIGSMTLQVGTHENQIIDVRIPAVTCESLYIDDLNVARVGGADKAIAALDDAISQVSEVRSRIGAYQNRLEYAVKSLDGTEENMESAISRIMDTDMAEEMSTYSNMNVLDQAAISVLTQANDMPQQILQLLN